MDIFRLVRFIFEMILVVLYNCNIHKGDYDDSYCMLVDYMGFTFALRTLPDIVYFATYSTTNVEIIPNSTNDSINPTLFEKSTMADDFYKSLQIRDNNYRENMSFCFFATSLLGAIGLYFLLRYNHKNKPNRLPDRYFSYYLTFLLVFFFGMMLFFNLKPGNAIVSTLVRKQLEFYLQLFSCLLTLVLSASSLQMVPPDNLSQIGYEFQLYQNISRIEVLFRLLSIATLIDTTLMLFDFPYTYSVYASIIFLGVIVLFEPYRSRIPLLNRFWLASL